MTKNLTKNEDKNKIISFIPTGEYYYHKGLKAHERHDLLNAKKYFERAGQLEPNEPLIVCQLAMVYTELGQFEQSIELLEKVIREIDENMVECYYFIANNYAYMSLFHEANKYASKYLELDGNGDFAEAAKELLEVIQIDDDEESRQLYEEYELMHKQEEAREMLESGNYEQAIQVLTGMIDQQPDFWSAYNNLALAYFYMGNTNKAFAVLETVLEKKPGNFHAICNMVVFYYYQGNKEAVAKMIKGLEKVKPIYFEHRYKLGATFALIGHYEKAYFLLKRLENNGYTGDAAYYYWLAQSAYKTGRIKRAKNAWKKLVEIKPHKKGMEPWENENSNTKGFENHTAFILNKLQSKSSAERLFGIFLLALTNQKRMIMQQPDIIRIEEMTLAEKLYLAFVLEAGNKQEIDPYRNIEKAHHIACLLYENNRPIILQTNGLLMTWFQIFLKMFDVNMHITNCIATAAAVDYLWKNNHSEKRTQKDIANQYQISTSTLQKYIKNLRHYYR